MKNNKYLTAKEARQIVNDKTAIYNQECDEKAKILLEKVMDQIEQAANNKIFKILFDVHEEYQVILCLGARLRDLGYVTNSTPINPRSGKYNLEINW